MNRKLESYPDVLSPTDIMEILNIGRSNTYKLLRSGELRSIKIGKQYRIPKKYLLQFLHT